MNCGTINVPLQSVLASARYRWLFIVFVPFVPVFGRYFNYQLLNFPVDFENSVEFNGNEILAQIKENTVDLG